MRDNKQKLKIVGRLSSQIMNIFIQKKKWK